MFPPIQTQHSKFLNPAQVLAQLGVGSGMKVADFGCGSGEWVILVARMVGQDGQVYAVDVQDSALSSVRSRARMEGFLNITTVKANVEMAGSTGIPKASLDAVLLSNILFQSRNKEGICAETFRTLKPKSLLFFADWRKDAPLGPSRELRLDKSEVSEFIAKAGFSFVRDVEAGAYHMGMVFAKKET